MFTAKESHNNTSALQSGSGKTTGKFGVLRRAGPEEGGGEHPHPGRADLIPQLVTEP
jgi:hypothetical protein